MSQLDLAAEADISSKHLSFVETGRALPSREMLLHLAEQLNIPLRERNVLLVAAGYAPVFAERSLDDTALDAARRAVEQVLTGHEPFPALAVNRHWTMLMTNRAIPPLLVGVSPSLLAAPVNVLRLSLHPDGIAPRIANLPAWRAHLLARLRQQVDLTADPVLASLYAELSSYPAPREAHPRPPSERDDPGFVVPFQLRTENALLSFFSTTTIFGTPLDITLSEIAIESFFPADHATSEAVRRLAELYRVER
jgi:transcriptional regulator with XRE-family HTH domain